MTTGSGLFIWRFISPQFTMHCSGGVDLRGYLYWSLMDNYEWGSFKPHFGLVNVDFTTFERRPKPSAMFFREIIRQNGFTQDILRKYLHELPTLGLVKSI